MHPREIQPMNFTKNVEELRRNDRKRSIALLFLSLLLVGASSGLVYGWPALRLLLQEEMSRLTETQLGLIYTIGTWNSQAGRFFLGLARDRYGTKIVCTISLLMVMCGLIGIAICDASDFATLSVSDFFLGSGSGVQFCVLPVASLFPDHVGTVMSSLSGAFQVSTLVFNALASFDSTRRTLFLIYACIVLMLAILSATFLPKSQSFLSDENQESERPVSEKDSLLKKDEESNELSYAALQKSATLRKADCMPTVQEQMMTREYCFVNAWFSLAIIPMQYYIGIIGFQLREVGDRTGRYSSIFSYIFAGAAASAPFSGSIADRFGLGIAQAISTMLLALSFIILTLKGEMALEMQTYGMIFFSVGRLGIFGLYFSNLGRRFGYANYGTLAAFGLLASAFSSMLQYPLIAWSVNGYSSMIDAGLGISLILLMPYFYWLHQREKHYESAISVERTH